MNRIVEFADQIVHSFQNWRRLKEKKKLSTHAEGDEGKGNNFNKIKFVNPLKRRKNLKKEK
jgi:hypothetical protein